MTSTMGPEQGSVKGDLERVADKANADRVVTDEPVANAIAGAARLIDPCLSTIRSTSSPLVGCAVRLTFGSAIHTVVVIDQVPPGVGGDHHPL